MSRRSYLWLLGAGLLLGFTLSSLGFTDFDQVHSMFTLASPRLYFTFAGAVLLTGIVLRLLTRGYNLSSRPLHKGTVAGGVLFGLGWAATGACPGAAFAQLGEGQVLALLSLSGIAGGTVFYKWIDRRFFRWDRGACEDG